MRDGRKPPLSRAVRHDTEEKNHMSAFLFGSDGIDRVIAAINYGAQKGCPTPMTLLMPANGVGLRLLAMNYKALQECYQERTTGHFGEAPSAYRNRPAQITEVQMLKSLQCFVYQCSEGDVVETPLFQKLDAIKKWFEERLGYLPPRNGLPTKYPAGYDAAQWG